MKPQSPIHILIIIRSMALLGGAEKQSLRLATQLMSKGHDVTVLGGRVGWKRPHADYLNVDGTTISVYSIYTPDIRLVGSLVFILGVSYHLLFRNAKTQIVQIVSIKRLQMVLAVIARLMGKKVVSRVQGELFNARTVGIVRGENRVSVFLNSMVFKAAHVFVVQNSMLIDRLKAIGVEPKRIVKIANGIDTARFCPADRSKKRLRDELNLPNDGQIICSTSTLAHIKRVDLLVEAFSRCSIPGTALLLIGDGPEQSAIVKQAAELNLTDRIQLAGRVNDVVHYLQASDVFVLPSDYEAHSNGLLEAMACGLPVIATAIGGNADTITHGTNGLLTPVGQAQALADQLTAVLTNQALAARLGLQARQTVLEQFDLSRMVDQYETLYYGQLQQQ